MIQRHLQEMGMPAEIKSTQTQTSEHSEYQDRNHAATLKEGGTLAPISRNFL